MPALTIPLCGYGAGSEPTTDSGIEGVIAVGGSRRGFTDYDSSREELAITFSMCTIAEYQAQMALYQANKLTGGMTLTPPWSAGSLTCDYIAPPKMNPIANSSYVVVTLRLRQQ